MRFRDRAEAGRKLADALKSYYGENVVVFALPRGGVVLGVEIANALDAPLDLVIPRKIGHPWNPEYAVAAVTESGELVVNENEVAQLDKDWFAKTVEAEVAEAKRRRSLYLKGKSKSNLRGKTAVIADDGIATGLTMQAAIKDLKARHPGKLVVAIPVVPADTAEVLKQQADELVALSIDPMYLGAVGAYYEDFPQVSDEEVISLLERCG